MHKISERSKANSISVPRRQPAWKWRLA